MLSGTRCGGLEITIDVPKEHLLYSTRCGGLEITIDVPKEHLLSSTRCGGNRNNDRRAKVYNYLW